MKDYRGVVYHSIDHLQTREAVATIDDFLRQLNFGVAKIALGETPDASGNTIPALDDYLFKPGLPANQTAHGGTLASGSLTLVSTRNLTRGRIYLGAAQTSVFDEVNSRIGISTAAPTAKLHIAGTAAPTFIAPDDTGSGLPASWAIVGGAGSYHASVNETPTANDATYVTNNGVTGTIGFVRKLVPGAMPPGTTSATLKCKVRKIGSAGTSTFNYGLAREFGGFSVTISGYAGTASFAILEYPLTPTNLSDFFAGTGYAEFAHHTTGINPSDVWDVSWAVLELNSPGSSNLVLLENSSGNDVVTVANSGATTIALGLDSTPLSLVGFTTQTSDLFKATVTGGTTPFKLTGTAKLVTTLAPQFDIASAATGSVWVATDADGNGVWSTLSALSPAEFTDSAFRIIGSADPTKKLAFEVDGLSAGTRTLTPQNASYTLAGLEITNTFTADQTITGATLNLRRDDSAPLRITDVANTMTLDRIDEDGHARFSDISGNGQPLTIYNGDITGGAGSVTFDVFNVTGSRTLTLPDANGLVVLSGQSTQLILTTPTTLRSDTATTGASFVDNTNTTKRIRFILSTAIGNNVFRINSTTARTYDFPNASIDIVGAEIVTVDTDGNVVTADGELVLTGG